MWKAKSMNDPSDNPTFDGLIPMAEFCEFLLFNSKYSFEVRSILDLGACDGRDSLVFRKYFPEARVVAVEALQENYDRWMLHLERIEPYCLAIDGASGISTFHVKEINGISSLRNRGSQYAGFARQVPTSSLDDFCSAISLQPDILKIDVEGCSYDVLRGGRDALKTVQAIHIETESIEFFEGQVLDDKVSDFLFTAGFECIQTLSGGIIENSKGESGFQYESVWVRYGL